MVYCPDFWLILAIVMISRFAKAISSVALSVSIFLPLFSYGLGYLEARAQSSETKADPIFLPVAQGQVSSGNPQSTTTAGSFYLDPTSGVRVWRATGPDYPCAGNGGGFHDYGDVTQISRDLGGGKHTILIHTCGEYRLVDFTRGQGFGNWRDIASDATPNRDLDFSFSNKKETPHIAYSIHGSTLVRYNTVTNQVENIGFFPFAFGNGDWLQNDEFDRMFVITQDTTCKAWNSEINQLLTYAWDELDECHLENHGRYVDLNTGVGGDRVWDLAMNTVKPLTPPSGNIFHNASPSGYFTAVDVESGRNTPHFRMDPVTGAGVQIHDFCGYVSGFHQSGNWIQEGESDERQWFVISTHENGGNGCLRNAIGFMRLDGSDVRFLAHNFSQGGGYFQTPFGTISPDGKVAMFNSTGGRAAGDVYVAEVPLNSINNTVTPSPSATSTQAAAPSPTLTPIPTFLPTPTSSPSIVPSFSLDPTATPPEHPPLSSPTLSPAPMLPAGDCAQIRGDVTCDGSVDVADLASLADVTALLRSLPTLSHRYNADVDADGRVRLLDLIILADRLVGRA